MNTKRLITSLLIGAQLTAVIPAFAQTATSTPLVVLPPSPPLQPGEVDVGAALSPMKKGQIAPFTGVLLSPKATATIIAQLNSMHDLIKIEIDHARTEEQVKCNFRIDETKTYLEADKKVLQAHVIEQQKRISIITDQLKKEEANKSNTTLWTGIGTGVGFVLGVGLSVLTVYAVGQSSK